MLPGCPFYINSPRKKGQDEGLMAKQATNGKSSTNYNMAFDGKRDDWGDEPKVWPWLPSRLALRVILSLSSPP